MVAAASLPACPITIMRRGSGRRCSHYSIHRTHHGRPQDDQSQIQLAAVIIAFEL
jgi:hypothetical protein